MKILVANKFFFRNGGSETVMFLEREYLLSAGHAVIDFSMHDDRNEASEYSGYFVAGRSYRARRNPLQSLGDAISFVHSREAVGKIGSLIDATQPDVLHCHNIYHQLTPSIIGAAKARGVRVVLTVHDSKPVCPVYTRLRDGVPCSKCLDGAYLNVLRYRCADRSLAKSALLYAEATFQRWKGSYEQVDRFITPSRFMAESIQRRIPAEKLVLLYNGVDTQAIRSSPRDDGYVLYMGRLSSEKGVETLLRAHAQASPSFRLVVAGAGPLLEMLRERYKAVEFTGHLPWVKAKELASSAAVVVVPSEWYENCPMSVLEAMALGKPVVAARIGGIPELVDEGNTGLLYEPGDARQLAGCIERLMAAPDLRARMGSAGRARAEERFSLERHNAGLMRVYADLA
jgi:glycosyltransferase involved in cell wall biosynthesis